MKNEIWAQGMSELLACFPDRDLPQEVLATRGDVYRRELTNLTDDAWLFAVREAIRSERWFPTVAGLLDYARGAPASPIKAGLLLPEDTRTPEQKRADDATGLAMIQAALEKLGYRIERITADMPTARPPVVATPERLDELRRQADLITAQQPENDVTAGGA